MNSFRKLKYRKKKPVDDVSKKETKKNAKQGSKDSGKNIPGQNDGDTQEKGN